MYLSGNGSAGWQIAYRRSKANKKISLCGRTSHSLAWNQSYIRRNQQNIPRANWHSYVSEFKWRKNDRVKFGIAFDRFQNQSHQNTQAKSYSWLYLLQWNSIHHPRGRIAFHMVLRIKILQRNDTNFISLLPPKTIRTQYKKYSIYQPRFPRCKLLCKPQWVTFVYIRFVTNRPCSSSCAGFWFKCFSAEVK